jgi:hypothetical protein
MSGRIVGLSTGEKEPSSSIVKQIYRRHIMAILLPDKLGYLGLITNIELSSFFNY